MTRKEWKQLSTEEKNLKVAEICGWQPVKKDNVITGWISPSNTNWNEGKSEQMPLPDFIHDLNAMYNAIEYPTLMERDNSIGKYIYNLSKCSGAEPIFASAEARAEALVLTIENIV